MTQPTIEAFLAALADRGIRPKKLQADGRIHRCGTERKPRSTNGAYCLHMDGDIPAGWYENHEDGLGVMRWRANTLSTLTPAERIARRRRLERERLQREEEVRQKQATAARRAREIYGRAGLASTDHPYLSGKNIRPHRIRVMDGRLVIPIYDDADEIVNVQYIFADGTKRFLAGGRKRGCFHFMSQFHFAPHLVFIGEGYATMASVYEATAATSITAFDCGNLKPVALALRRKFPDARIAICADNDPPGRSAAEETVRAVSNCIAAWPPREGDDFNDIGDPEEIRTILSQALRRKTGCEADVG